MNAIEPADLWTLLAHSRLVDAGVVADLRREYDARPEAAGDAGGSLAIAQWLASRGVVTVWQARRLARGDRGPYFVGDYRLLARLEAEGPGGLFRARHEPSGRIVQIAVLNAARCRQLAVWTGIVRRTTIAHQAADPVLSRTWALEQAGPNRFIVCEDIPAATLADELAAQGPMPLATAGPLILEIARAVAELHRLGEVHGAISLDTLRRGQASAGNAGVRLAQFPLTGDPHEEIPRIPVDDPQRIEPLGRRASFVAPELMLPGRVCDTRSDVYSIGCVLHALVTGTLPCWQGDAQRTLAQAAFVGVPPLAPPIVPVEIATLIGYLTARDPAGRYPSAAEAADAIASCLGRPPISPTLPPQRPFAAQPAPIASSAVQAAQPGTASAAIPQPFADPSTSFPRPAAAAPPVATPPRTKRARSPWLAGLAGVVVVVGLAAAVAVIRGRQAPPPQPDDAAAHPSSTAVARAPAEPATVAAEESPTSVPPPSENRPPEQGTAQTAVISGPAITDATPAPAAPSFVDDPNLPWGSPTSGRPPTFAYLPPGAQVILLARPAEIKASDEGRLFIKALGPHVEAALELVAKTCGCDLDGIEEIQAGWQAAESGNAVGGYAIRLREPADAAVIAQAVGGAATVDIGGETLHEGKALGFWLPSADGGSVVVLGPASTVREIIEADARIAADLPTDAAGLRAELPRDMELLAGMLDHTRHVTLIGAPHYLLNDGRGVLAGPLARLLDPLGEFLGESLKAAAVSLHFGEAFYAELDCVATIDAPPKALAAALADRIAGLAATVEEYCARLDLAPYGRKLVMRLPAMIRIIADSTRVGVEGPGVVVNCYLPRHAGHNLALATELALQQTPLATGQTAAAGTATTVADALAKKMTLTFVKDTLEKSIQMVSDEIGVPMDILGKDLELEGITKNQSFGLEERDKTADEVLRAILLKANPDKKLVYVIRKKNGAEVIDITTKAAAAKRGDALPPGFEADAAAPRKSKKK